MSFLVTPVYDVLIRGTKQLPVGVYQLQLTTAEQLCRVHYSPGSIKTIKARLKTLVDAEYLQADAIPSRNRGNPSYYYTLGHQAMSYLGELGYDLNTAWRAVREVNKHGLFLEHTFGVNDLLISAALLHRADARYSLASFQHERVLKRAPFPVEWVRRDGVAQRYNLVPDGFVDFRLQLDEGQRRLPLLLEFDRGTEDQVFFKRRIRAYSAFLAGEGYKERFGTKSVTVAFVTFEGEERRDKMRQWTYAELGEAGALQTQAGVFCFTSMRQPPEPMAAWLSPTWYAPYELPPFALLAA